MEYKLCTKFKDRLIGNCFKKEIKKVLVFPKCNSIHTFFMRIPIDIIILNKDKEIIYIKENLKPWRILLPKKRGYYTLEYPAGSTKYNLNEKIEF
jgi:uncharacterized membrane protein (UPF0127 family)